MQLPVTIPAQLFVSNTPDGDKLRHDVAVGREKAASEAKQQEVSQKLKTNSDHGIVTAPTLIVAPLVAPTELQPVAAAHEPKHPDRKVGRDLDVHA